MSDLRIIGPATRERCDCEREACTAGHRPGACGVTARYHGEACGMRENVCLACAKPYHDAADEPRCEWCGEHPHDDGTVCPRRCCAAHLCSPELCHTGCIHALNHEHAAAWERELNR